MSLRLEMLQVARLAPKSLGEEASGLVETFFRSRQNPDGGFRGRESGSDLYYTVFGIDGLTALQAELPRDAIRSYLSSFGEGAGLDFVHLCCLLRAWSALPKGARGGFDGWADTIFARVEAFRTADGGYNQKPGARAASAYGCLLACGVHADHGRQPAGVRKLGEALEKLRTPDGAWGNEPGMKEGTTTATAAAVTLCRSLGMAIPEGVGAWLLGQFRREGGFAAFPRAPMPDLLSTGTALHALDGMQVPFGAIKEPCLDFIDTLWTAEGGFHGHWADDELDCEYTYYGLLALGHLSL